MPQDKFFKKELVAELRRVENLIKKENNVDKKIYYFSAMRAAFPRSLRR